MQQIFFCHISKTAGTALAQALEQSFSAEMVQPTRKAIAQNGGKYPGADTFLDQLAGARLVRGHYHLSFRDWLMDATEIVVMRDPIERAQSHLKHIMRQDPQKGAALLTKLEAGKQVVPDNVMTRMIGGHLKDSTAPDLLSAQREMMFGPVKDKAALLRSAKEALPSVKILGFTEALSDLSAKLKDIGISFDSEVYTNKTSKVTLSAAQIETLTADNELDQELYDFARSL